jgi:hypothetical protein
MRGSRLGFRILVEKGSLGRLGRFFAESLRQAKQVDAYLWRNHSHAGENPEECAPCGPPTA